MERLAFCGTGTTLKEQENNQTITFTAPNDWKFTVYALTPQNFFPGDNSPDGLILVYRPAQRPSSIVCFIEMKSSRQSASPQHARKQLEHGIAHFIPWKRCKCGQIRDNGQWKSEGLFSHGDKHHDRWTDNDGEDTLEINLESAHAVWGVRLVLRGSGGSSHPSTAGRKYL